jgi:hypothetical protein
MLISIDDLEEVDLSRTIRLGRMVNEVPIEPITDANITLKSTRVDEYLVIRCKIIRDGGAFLHVHFGPKGWLGVNPKGDAVNDGNYSILGQLHDAANDSASFLKVGVWLPKSENVVIFLADRPAEGLTVSSVDELASVLSARAQSKLSAFPRLRGPTPVKFKTMSHADLTSQHGPHEMTMDLSINGAHYLAKDHHRKHLSLEEQMGHPLRMKISGQPVISIACDTIAGRQEDVALDVFVEPF